MYRELEERGLNAWPAVRSLWHDGWELRFSAGFTRRANSVNALFPGTRSLAEKVAWCEEQYRAHGLPAIFKLTPATQPGILDQFLTEREYRRDAESDVLYASLDDLRITSDTANTVILPQEPWLDAYTQVTGQSAEDRQWHQAIVQAIVPTVCPVAVLEQDTPIAVGLGVLERGIVGIFDVVTGAPYRRQGCATRMLSAILSWAADQGAQGAYLQVMTENTPAMTLYTNMGFAPCYHYWYRVKHTTTQVS